MRVMQLGAGKGHAAKSAGPVQVNAVNVVADRQSGADARPARRIELLDDNVDVARGLFGVHVAGRGGHAEYVNGRIQHRQGQRKGAVDARIRDENRFAHRAFPCGGRFATCRCGIGRLETCRHGSLFLDAVKVAMAAQQQLFADEDGRGVNVVVQAVRRQHLQLVGPTDHQSSAVAANEVDAILRPGRRSVQVGQSRQPARSMTGLPVLISRLVRIGSFRCVKKRRLPASSGEGT